MRRARPQERPGDFIRKWVRWGPYAILFTIVCLVTTIVQVINSGEALSGLAPLFSGLFSNLMGLGIFWLLKSRMLANADLLDQMRDEELGQTIEPNG